MAIMLLTGRGAAGHLTSLRPRNQTHGRPHGSGGKPVISLEQDYIGASNGLIIVHGLKVCDGVLARLASSRLPGAHFTHVTTAAEILTGCTYLMTNWSNGSAVQDRYRVANLGAWQARADKYQNAHQLLSELKI